MTIHSSAGFLKVLMEARHEAQAATEQKGRSDSTPRGGLALDVCDVSCRTRRGSVAVCGGILSGSHWFAFLKISTAEKFLSSEFLLL